MKNQETTLSLVLLNELFHNKNKYFVSQQQGHQGIPDNSWDGMQGEYNETFRYYRHPEMPENIFLCEISQTDSYGSNESITEYSFVEGKAKQITVYEPIK